MFYVGQKVVCVKDSKWSTIFADETAPAYRETVTVREVLVAEDVLCLMFHEHRNPPVCIDGTECCFEAKWFRPIQERKTDIGFAHEILRKVTKRKPVVVRA